jgi:hypothetical protein
MHLSACLTVLLAVLASAGRVDEDVVDEHADLSRPRGHKKARHKIVQVPYEEDADSAQAAVQAQAEQGDAELSAADENAEEAVKAIEEEEESEAQTAVGVALSAHESAKASKSKSVAAREAASHKHIKATNDKDMAYVFSEIKKSAAEGTGYQAHRANQDKLAADRKLHDATAKQEAATIHEHDAIKLAQDRRARATVATEIRINAEKTFEKARDTARFTKEKSEMATRQAADAKADSDQANLKAKKARGRKVEAAEIAEASEHRKVDTTAALHTAAAKAVHAVHADAKAIDHLNDMKNQAAQSKLDLAAAKRKREEAEQLTAEAAEDAKEADRIAEESKWALHGAVDNVGTHTSLALSALVKKTAAHSEAQTAVSRHNQAETAGVAAKAAEEVAATEVEEASAEVDKAAEDLPQAQEEEAVPQANQEEELEEAQ